MFEKKGNEKAKALFNEIVNEKYGTGVSSASTKDQGSAEEFMSLMFDGRSNVFASAGFDKGYATKWVERHITKEQRFNMIQLFRANRRVDKVMKEHGWTWEDDITGKVSAARHKVIVEENYPGFDEEYDRIYDNVHENGMTPLTWEDHPCFPNCRCESSDQVEGFYGLFRKYDIN